MYNDPKKEPLTQSDFFPNEASARPLIPNTVARGHLREDSLLFTGMVDGKLSDVFPFPITRERLQRGQERYTIYCSVCHGPNGYGNGMIVQRGFPAPPSFHIDRLRQAPPGHIYYVITHGYGVMYSYAARVAPEDRWAIAAYIRALQLSHGATTNDVPQPDLAKLLTSAP